MGSSRRVLLLVAFLFSSVFPAAAFDHAALAKRTLERHILPGYARFAGAAKAFAGAAAALCQGPSAAALARTRESAREALLTWGRIEHIRFGPITENQRLDRLLFYPDPRAIGLKQIDRLLKRQDAADLAPETLDHASVAVQGFAAVDIALFGNGSDALAARSDPAAFRCRYVQALADGIARIGADTLGAWSDGYRQAWLNPGPGNPAFLSAKEPTQALLRSYVTELGLVRLQRLLPVLGADPKRSGHARPLLPQSRLGLPFILADIEGVRDLLNANGFLDPALATDDKERSAMSILGSIATDLGFAERAGQRALGVAQDPLASPEAREALTPMIFSLKNAEETGRTALSDLTGLTLGFNSLDGD